MNPDRKWALVTGASSGFGMDFATELARKRFNLVLVARRPAPMEQLANKLRRETGAEIIVEAADLSMDGSASRLKEFLDRRGVAIHTLINNAGYGVFGDFVDQPLVRTMDMLRVNVSALTELTYLFGAEMKKRGEGEILLVSSIGGYQATPMYAAYSASKAYVLHFGEALHEELAPYGVTVTVVSPGISSTGFLSVSGQKATAYQRAVMMSSQAVVGAGLRALSMRKASVVPGMVNALTVLNNRFIPRAWQRKIAYRLMRN